MKLFTLILLATIAAVAAKNVFDLEKLRETIEGEKNDKFTLKLTKRDPKNVFKFPFQKSNHKRDQIVFQSHDNYLESVISQVNEISFFASYIRDDLKFSKLVEEEAHSMVIIAPTNNALEFKLNGLKPWEFPNPIQDDDSDEKVIHDNLNSFLSGHVIKSIDSLNQNDDHLKSNIIEGTLINGESVLIKQDANTGAYQIGLNGGFVPVINSILTNNGYLFIIDDVLVHP